MINEHMKCKKISEVQLPLTNSPQLKRLITCNADKNRKEQACSCITSWEDE